MKPICPQNLTPIASGWPFFVITVATIAILLYATYLWVRLCLDIGSSLLLKGIIGTTIVFLLLVTLHGYEEFLPYGGAGTLANSVVDYGIAISAFILSVLNLFFVTGAHRVPVKGDGTASDI